MLSRLTRRNDLRLLAYDLPTNDSSQMNNIRAVDNSLHDLKQEVIASRRMPDQRTTDYSMRNWQLSMSITRSCNAKLVRCIWFLLFLSLCKEEVLQGPNPEATDELLLDLLIFLCKRLPLPASVVHLHAHHQQGSVPRCLMRVPPQVHRDI
jgi:hypothetical protein